MRYLIVSDIHANREALDAVLHAASGEYDRALSCGDLVGYGADPNAVVEWARASLTAVVRGNHDRASVGLDDLEWFNPVARQAALWTGRELTPENAAYIRGLPKGPLRVEGFDLTHGSPLDEDEYMMDPGEATEAFHYVSGAVTFFGHTHLQGGFVWRRGRVETVRRLAPDEDRRVVRIEPDAAYLINPGSVGQPRDNDPRAAFVLYDAGAGVLSYRRLAYDYAAAQRRIREAGLPPVLADRLGMGR